MTDKLSIKTYRARWPKNAGTEKRTIKTEGERNKRLSAGRLRAMVLDEKGDISYVETFVTVFAVMILVAFAINVFSFFTLKQDLEYLAEQAVISAAADGSTAAAGPRIAGLCAELGIDPDALEYGFDGTDFIGGSSYVQYGDMIKINISYRTKLAATGLLTLPMTMTVSSTGLSEKYHKP